MRVLVSGSSGMIGSALTRLLVENGHTVSRLLRPQSKAVTSVARTESAAENADESASPPSDVHWDPVTGEFDAQAAEGADAVVHLAGASIGDGRWSEKRKAVLRSSRVDATRHLVDSLGTLTARPRTFIGISAMGIYGNRGDEKLTEHSGPGGDF